MSQVCSTFLNALNQVNFFFLSFYISFSYRFIWRYEKLLDFILRFLAMTMTEQAHHCSSGLTKPFADERALLWRLMRGGCNIASNAPSLISSNASYMQF